jgi:hypothetical protein
MSSSLIVKRLGWLVFLLAAAGSLRAEGYRTTLGTAPDDFPVVVVSGTPYEMGLALGKLTRPEIEAFAPAFLAAARQSGGEALSPQRLEEAWRTMEPCMSSRFKEELQGLAEGSGLPLALLQQAHMIPVISEYSCSGVALWGPATRNGHLYQIRNLDYTLGAHLQDFPCVVIYVPKEGLPHLNPAFAGSIGCHTGMNAQGITLTEIGDSPGIDKPYDLHGLHFMMMFRDILYSARTLDQAVAMIQDAKRIKKYHFVVGDGKLPGAVKMRAWAPDLLIWKDNDAKDEMAPQVFKGIVYHAESRTPTALGHFAQYAKGRYDADAVIQLSTAIGSLGGNLMNAVYDATSRQAWLSYAKKGECAYRRPYVRLDLDDFIPYNPANPKVKIHQVVR